MHYVYLIQGKNNRHIYVGCTDNVERRLTEHNDGRSSATKNYAPFGLVYYEAYLDKADASNREHKLKHHGSVIGHLKKRLKNSLTK